MNQEVLAYLRAFITYAQYDWPQLLPTAQLAINNRNSSIGLSPFFLTHGYHAEPIQQIVLTSGERKTLSLPAKRAHEFVERIREAQDFAASAMAAAQQRMEDSANRSRAPAERFVVGDTVWLSLRNMETPQPKKKLAWLNAKYKVTKVISPHNVKLDVPTGVWPVFHVDLLRRAATDPLPSQVITDSQPPPIIPATPTSDAQYEVERVLRAERNSRRGGPRRELLIKWTGYEDPTWEPRVEFEHTDALDDFKRVWGTGDGVGEPLGAHHGRRARTRRGGG